MKEQHSPQHVTAFLSERSINLDAQLVRSSFCRAAISQQAPTIKSGKQEEGGLQSVRVKIQKSTEARMFHSHSYRSTYSPPKQGEYKGEVWTAVLNFLERFPASLCAFFFPLHFHSQATQVWE